MMLKKPVLIIFGIILSFVILETGLRFAAWIAQSNLNHSSFSDNKKLKILCLGDSYTYGLGVERDQAYPAQLELLLKAKLEKDKVEVINAGRPGMNTPLLANNFDSLLDTYRPDIVLVMIGTNDEWNFSEFISDNNLIRNKIAEFFYSLRVARMFKILKTGFKQQDDIGCFEVQADKKNISKMLDLIEKNGGLNNEYYYQAILLANQYRDKNMFEEAKLYYDCALKINPDDALISKELLRYHKNTLTALRKELKKDHIIEILQEIERLGGFEKAYYPDLIKFGNECRDDNNFEQAKLYYDSALKINPNDQQIELELMRYYIRLSKTLNDEFNRDALAAIKASLSNYIRSVYLNKQHLELGNKFMLEMLDLSKICRIFSLFEDDLLLLAKTIYLYGLNRDIREEAEELFISWQAPAYAIELYQILLNKYPNNLDIYLRLAGQYKIVQDYNQVVKNYKKVLELNPDDQLALEGIITANQFLKQGLTKDYVLPGNTAGLFAQIKVVLEGGKSEIQTDDPVINLVKSPEVALSVYVKAQSDDNQDEEILSQDKDDASLFGKNPSDHKALVNKRLAKINNIVSQRIKQICSSAQQGKVKILFLSYPLSVYQRVAETVEEENIPFIDFRQSFFSIITPDNYKEYFLADGHCTPKGYKIVADKIAQIIKETILFNGHDVLLAWRHADF
ncbi:MAG: hypothetical protein KJ915_04435 [Candidatus Omnitrophica bacterium]|nr:hypothetical protein [Candidatus Omnitrophota bacterium]